MGFYKNVPKNVTKLEFLVKIILNVRRKIPERNFFTSNNIISAVKIQIID